MLRGDIKVMWARNTIMKAQSNQKHAGEAAMSNCLTLDMPLFTRGCPALP